MLRFFKNVVIWVRDLEWKWLLIGLGTAIVVSVSVSHVYGAVIVRGIERSIEEVESKASHDKRNIQPLTSSEVERILRLQEECEGRKTLTCSLLEQEGNPETRRAQLTLRIDQDARDATRKLNNQKEAIQSGQFLSQAIAVAIMLTLLVAITKILLVAGSRFSKNIHTWAQGELMDYKKMSHANKRTVILLCIITGLLIVVLVTK